MRSRRCFALSTRKVLAAPIKSAEKGVGIAVSPVNVAGCRVRCRECALPKPIVAGARAGAEPLCLSAPPDPMTPYAVHRRLIGFLPAFYLGDRALSALKSSGFSLLSGVSPSPLGGKG